jgi:hypothetical protein
MTPTEPRSLGDAMFHDPADAFAWLDRHRRRKAEIALTLLQVAYSTLIERQDTNTDAQDSEPI